MKPTFLILGAVGGLLVMAGAAAAWYFWKIDGLVAIVFAASAGSFAVWCVREGYNSSK
jgi:zinc transporter ZupT